MVQGLVGDMRRQTTDSIRGYVYQAYQSVLAWMRLGSEKPADGNLLEEAALTLRRIREETLLPNDLFVCPFRLLNALCSGEWG
jgi:hypothetical protein